MNTKVNKMEKRIYEKDYVSSINNESNDYWNNYNNFNGNVRWVKSINADDDIGFNNSNDIGENEGISYNSKSKINDISENTSTKKDTISNNTNISNKAKATEENQETLTDNVVDNSQSASKSNTNIEYDDNNDDNYDDNYDNNNTNNYDDSNDTSNHEKVEYNANEINKESVKSISSSTNNFDTNFDNNTSLINKNIPNNSAIASVDIKDDENVNSFIFPVGVILSILIVIAIGTIFFVHKKKLNNNDSKGGKKVDEYSDEALLNVPNDDVIIGYTELLKNNKENNALKNYQNDIESTPVKIIDINVPEHTVTIENH